MMRARTARAFLAVCRSASLSSRAYAAREEPHAHLLRGHDRDGRRVGAGAVTALNAQSTPKAYIVTEVDVTGNMDVFLKDYAAHVQATVDPFGGRYLVRGGRNVGIEGDPPNGRIVISVFDSFEKAQAWRDSPEYKKIVTVREREAKSRMYIVEGLPGVQ
jgi:uncharacterized protein (DUF1330 family)